MSSQIITVTVQAAMFSALSTILAQGITVWQHQKLSSIDPVSFLGFILIAMITTPLNYLYQRFLEDKFPSKVTPRKPKKAEASDSPPLEQLSIPNTVAKLCLDQSIGAAANTVMFIFLLGMIKGKTFPQIAIDIQKDFWPMITAGWRVWPIVSLSNLLVVPFEYRMLVGNTVGVFWGVYINLKTM